MGYTVPSFWYPGGKSRIREWLVSRMPLSGGKYVEPFAGRGSVFWLAVHMLDFREWWLNDPWTARWFEAIQRVDLQSIPSHLTRKFALHMYKEAMKNRDHNDLAVAIEGKVMFGGGPGKSISGHWKIQPSMSGLIGRLKVARSILKQIQVRVTGKDWRECGLEKLGGSDFVYLDPPYLGCTPGIYMAGELDHGELLRYLREAPFLWMLSGYMSPLYTRLLGEPYAARNKNVFLGLHSAGNPTHRKRLECIWTNYTIGSGGEVVRKRVGRGCIAKKIRQK